MNIIDYIRGKRIGKAANRLEREAMNDPFLQDALDGYDLVDGDHIKNIEKLQDRIKESTLTKKRKPFLFTKKGLAIAASFTILIVGIGFLIRAMIDRPEVYTASQKTDKVVIPPDNRPDVVPLIKDTVLLADNTPLKKKLAKRKPTQVMQSVDSTDDQHENFAQQTLSDEVPFTEGQEIYKDTMMLAMDKQKDKSRKIEEALSNLEGVSSMDGEITSVRGNRSDGQTVIDGVRIRNRSAVMDKNELEKYFIANFNKSLCPGIEGKIIVKVFINYTGIPEIIEIKGTSCESFESELIRILKEKGIWSRRGQKIKLNFKF